VSKPSQRSVHRERKSKAPARAKRARLRGSRAKKVSVTIDERVLGEAKKVARSSGRTLSAHVTEALARDLRQRRLQRLLEDYEAAHGVITEEELAAVRSQWQV